MSKLTSQKLIQALNYQYDMRMTLGISPFFGRDGVQHMEFILCRSFPAEGGGYTKKVIFTAFSRKYMTFFLVDLLYELQGVDHVFEDEVYQKVKNEMRDKYGEYWTR